DADEHLDGVAERVEEGAIGGHHRLLLLLRLEGEVDALGLDDGPVVAATKAEHALDDLFQREHLLDASVLSVRRHRCMLSLCVPGSSRSGSRTSKRASSAAAASRDVRTRQTTTRGMLM